MSKVHPAQTDGPPKIAPMNQIPPESGSAVIGLRFSRLSVMPITPSDQLGILKAHNL
jgi:hypothetical protein